MMKPTEETTASARPRQSRIPLALQAVFLASNRGKDVHKPPPEKAGSKVFFNNWFFQRKKGDDSKRKLKFMKFRTKNKKTSIEENTTASPRVNDKCIGSSSQKVEEEERVTQKCQHPLKNEVKPLNPHVYLDCMLRSRGYSTQRFKTLRTAYYNKPTPLQEASYDAYLIGLIRRNEVTEFAEIMSCGLSPNACNRFGESVVHTVCRHGNDTMLQTLIENGACLQVSDDYGRTPLHDACWAPRPAFETIRLILKHDVRLFHMMDARGDVPLNYVREEHWSDWIDFLESNADLYWPVTGEKQEVPALTLEGVDTRPLADPINSLSCELAKMVACGSMKPEEARFLISDDTTDTLCSDEEDDYDEDDDDDDESCTDDDYSDYDDDDDSYCSSEEDEDEMEQLLASLPSQFRGQ